MEFKGTQGGWNRNISPCSRYPIIFAGEHAWRVIAAQNHGVAKVFNHHAHMTIRQLRSAGYSVSKAVNPIRGDDDLIAALTA